MESIDSNTKEMLLRLQRETFSYFVSNVNEHNGLITDSSDNDTRGSIASVGLALSCYTVAVNRELITRAEAIKKTLTVLRFFYQLKQGAGKDASGYMGFYYHFLNMETGKRDGNCELSSIDTALFLIGALTAQSFFIEQNEEEIEIRTLADKLYERVNWQWMLNGGVTLSHGWKPESGFISHHWNNGYSEALLLYVLSLAAPNHAIDKSAYREWTSTFKWETRYSIEHFFAGPLFIHQLSQIWIDCRGINDDVSSSKGIDYFENSKRATAVQQKYAIHNPMKFDMYGDLFWGLSATDGPGDFTKKDSSGRKIEFFNYIARGIGGPDDGTIAPAITAASLPFLPEIVINTLKHFIADLGLANIGTGLCSAFNADYPEKNTEKGWMSFKQYGLNQGPVVLMIENYLSGLVWETMRNCKYIKNGLGTAGFTGGWLKG